MDEILKGTAGLEGTNLPAGNGYNREDIVAVGFVNPGGDELSALYLRERGLEESKDPKFRESYQALRDRKLVPRFSNLAEHVENGNYNRAKESRGLNKVRYLELPIPATNRGTETNSRPEANPEPKRVFALLYREDSASDSES